MESLKRQEIIRRKRDFDRLFSHGKRYQNRNLRILWCLGPERRVGFITTKKLGIAVERNRIRRLLREAYRRNRFCFADNAELIIMARPEARGLDYRSIEEGLMSLVRRAGLVRDENSSHFAH